MKDTGTYPAERNLVSMGPMKENNMASASGTGDRPSPQGPAGGLRPRATYRLQLGPNFTFEDAARTVPYLARLGISHLYLSPIFAARTGSTHGYDVTDLSRINPNLGGRQGFELLSDTARAADLGIILDIVPNHMAADGQNPWWASVLEWGRLSPHARAFDVDWDGMERLSGGKLRLPILGDWYAGVLSRGEIACHFEAERGRFELSYFEHRFPVAPGTYLDILRQAGGIDSTVRDPLGPVITRIANAIGRMAGAKDSFTDRIAASQDFDGAKLQLATVAEQPEVRRAIRQVVTLLGTPAANARAALHNMLDTQAYQLVYWRTASQITSYRRFFDINDLAAVRMEEPTVFLAAHETLLGLVREGRIHGLRIDHIDGLRDPEAYLEQLREAVEGARPATLRHQAFPIFVEKILEQNEELPGTWPVDGGTGYRFLNYMTDLAVDAHAEEALTDTLERWTGVTDDFHAVVREAKLQILTGPLAGDVNRVARRFMGVLRNAVSTADVSVEDLTRALTELIAALPVYRTYITRDVVRPEDEECLRAILRPALEGASALDRGPMFAVVMVIDAALGGPSLPDIDRNQAIEAALDLQQITGAAMARSVEDTAFYRYPRLLSFNEVGGNPASMGMQTGLFHSRMANRAHTRRASMSTTATHDHKRGEDVRARLNVLSECTDLWDARVAAWFRLTSPLREHYGDTAMPSDTDIYYFFQTLTGVWPPEGLQGPEAYRAFAGRIAGVMRKSAREAKRETSWHSPNVRYEQALERFVRAALDPGRSKSFLDEVQDFVRRIGPSAAVNGLCQTVLKLTCPGVSDFYQGTERWDLSLVDPDNRRPVDFAALEQGLDGLEGRSWGEILANWQDGAVKQYVVRNLLDLRARAPEVFADGTYEPFAASGKHASRVIGFMRRGNGSILLVVTPRLVFSLLDGEPGLVPRGWEDTHINVSKLPPEMVFEDVLGTGTLTPAEDGGLRIADLLKTSPIAVFHGHLAREGE